MTKQQPSRKRREGTTNVNVDGHQMNVPDEWYGRFAPWCKSNRLSLKEGVIAAVDLMLALDVVGGWAVSAPQRQPATFARWRELAIAAYYQAIDEEKARVMGAGPAGEQHARQDDVRADAQARKSESRDTPGDTKAKRA